MQQRKKVEMDLQKKITYNIVLNEKHKLEYACTYNLIILVNVFKQVKWYNILGYKIMK